MIAICQLSGYLRKSGRLDIMADIPRLWITAMNCERIGEYRRYNVIKMHLNALTYFGGFTDTIRYDNMKRVVIDLKIKGSQNGARFREIG